MPNPSGARSDGGGAGEAGAGHHEAGRHEPERVRPHGRRGAEAAASCRISSRPSCDDLDAIDKAGADAIAASLETIARLTRVQAEKLLERNARTPGDEDKLVVTYGGALHNDLGSAADRASWSFGPALSAKVADRYVEVDIFVPEFIEDTDTWKKLEWYPHYDKQKLGGKVTVFSPRPRGYVVLFALGRSEPLSVRDELERVGHVALAVRAGGVDVSADQRALHALAELRVREVRLVDGAVPRELIEDVEADDHRADGIVSGFSVPKYVS